MKECLPAIVILIDTLFVLYWLSLLYTLYVYYQNKSFLSFFISFQVATVSDNPIYPMQNTRGPGLMGCKTDTGQKHMPMQVRHGFSFCSSLKTNLRVLSNVMAFNLFTFSHTLDKLFKTEYTFLNKSYLNISLNISYYWKHVSHL